MSSKKQILVQDYSEKSFVLRGEETKEYKDQIITLGGKWNSKLSGGGGWIFSNKQKDKVKNWLDDETSKNSIETSKNLIETSKKSIETSIDSDMNRIEKKLDKIISLLEKNNINISDCEEDEKIPIKRLLGSKK